MRNPDLIKGAFTKALILLTLSVLIPGCATIFTGTTDTISFDSTPERAIVYKDGPKEIHINTKDNLVDV